MYNIKQFRQMQRKLVLLLTFSLVISGMIGWIPINAYADQESTDAVHIYVAKTGDDLSGDGLINHPFLTLQKAKEVVHSGH
ncbi:hypothetical protein EHS13_09905 [Paenibacillus psychroresistens]|uniref:Uncharacterized protein n=1 Tax=Paenibacillus psychroresistens TaxID=1778678 RepID=A0A6B8RIG8_9BACL|nr:hypothetical protein [Paenibacillus psychroresistens]QGQ95176.1 hypothetical protein EHS13_09905 [Paenibacillus psychroresistens]